MDFNTERGEGRPDDQSRPLFSEEAGGRPVGGSARGPAGGPRRGEFNLQDPVDSFINTVREVVLNPVGFFRGIRRQGDYVNPLVFALICAIVNGTLGGIIGFFVSLASGDPDVEVGGALAGLILGIILTPIITAVGLLIGSGLYHLLVLLLVRPHNAGFEATFRVVSYVSVTQLVSWVPVIGAIIAFAYGIVLSILGIREVHATTTGRAALVVLIPVAVTLFLILLLGAALFAVFVGNQQQQF